MDRQIVIIELFFRAISRATVQTVILRELFEVIISANDTWRSDRTGTLFAG